MAVNKAEFIKKLTELGEYVQYVIDEGHEVDDVTQSQLAVLEQGKNTLNTARTLIEKGTELPPAAPPPVAPPAATPDPGDPLAPVIPYDMNLEGTFKVAKSRVVADFAEAYSNRLTIIANGNQSEAARVAWLHVANYKRALRRARDSRVEG